MKHIGPYAVPESIVTMPIAPIDLSGAVQCGSGSYTFTKISGPAWLSVSSAGTISGTPTVASAEASLVVEICDSVLTENATQYTIPVGRVFSCAVCEVTRNGNQATVELVGSIHMGDMLIAARYHQGQLEGTSVAVMSSGVTTCTVSVPAGEGTDLRLYLMDSSFIPISQVFYCN